MRLGAVALLALHAVAVHRRERVALALHLVLRGGVAVDARHVRPVGRHVDVHVARGVELGHLEVAVLDVVAAAAEEVAGPAVRPLRPPDVRRDLGEVHARVGVARPARLLHVRAAGVVAGEAVDVAGAGEVEGLVAPAEADVALVAALAAARDPDAEVVEDVPLPDVADAPALDVLAALVVPVRRAHHLLGPAVVAGDAGLGDLLRLGEGALQLREAGVIDRRGGLLRVARAQGGGGRGVGVAADEGARGEGNDGKKGGDEGEDLPHRVTQGVSMATSSVAETVPLADRCLFQGCN